MKVFKNVWFIIGCATFVFLATLGAAYGVGAKEGFGCGGGTIGAMIPVAAGFSGLLVGVAIRFAPKDSDG